MLDPLHCIAIISLLLRNLLNENSADINNTIGTISGINVIDSASEYFASAVTPTPAFIKK